MSLVYGAYNLDMNCAEYDILLQSLREMAMKLHENGWTNFLDENRDMEIINRYNSNLKHKNMKTAKEIIEEQKVKVAKMKGISVEEYERRNDEQVNFILNFLNNGK